MNIKQAFPSNYLKTADLNGSHAAVTIERVEIEKLGSGRDAESKPILYFAGKAKGLVLNKTNANVISKLFGDETDGWIGKKVILYPTETEMGGEIVPCLRVREFKPGAPPPKPVPEFVDEDESVPF
jgi:hypothetical protein